MLHGCSPTVIFSGKEYHPKMLYHEADGQNFVILIITIFARVPVRITAVFSEKCTEAKYARFLPQTFSFSDLL